MPPSLGFVVFALVAAILSEKIDSVSASDVGKPLSSRLCEGGGYSLACDQGQTLHFRRAWFGRLAHDTKTCADNDVIAGNTSLGSQQLDLARDCGVSVLERKDEWCHGLDSGTGCGIAVMGLGDGSAGAWPCPDTVSKRYLYLEYSCVGEGPKSGAQTNIAPVSLSWMCIVLLYVNYVSCAFYNNRF